MPEPVAPPASASAHEDRGRARSTNAARRGSDDATDRPAAARSARDARRSLSPRGWFAKDGDIATSGLWTAPEASLACRASPGLALRVDGHYFADLIERQTGSKTSELSVALDGRVVASITLDKSGPFSMSAALPDDVLDGLSDLAFRCSGHFVPQEIGLGEDRRLLGWRAARIVLGEAVLLDATRTPAILPTEAIAVVAGLNLVGYLSAESGVGESVRSFAQGCRAVGLSYGTLDVGYQSRNRQCDRSLVDLPIADRVFAINFVHVNADQTQATLAALPRSHREADATIAYWHWEQPELPLSSLAAFDGLAEVWVPSGFVHEAVATIAPIPVFKVPHVVEFPVPDSLDRARFGLPTDRFLVLAMYDFDSYQYRKNPQAAIEAYRRACKSRGDTALVLKTINADRDPDGRRALLEATADLDDVHCIDGYLDRTDVHALELACDCLLSLHRSEGFGLALAEMMYLGKPVIATGWSGNTEFMTPMNSFPVEYELKPLANAIGPYEAGQLWAEADVEHASHALGRLFDDASLRRDVGARAAADMREHFSAKRIGSLYRRRLSLLLACRP